MWTAQTKEDHDVELAQRHLVRTERHHADGWATAEELADARRGLERALDALNHRVLMRVDSSVAYEARRMAREMGAMR